ncbi:40S ribosomal protein S27 [Cyphellophora attinorum]|uniref:40S ribosomal protein S27 n=1 Tax=Cyphellophora attinorum TaxID=1664694 RepID=A0A0N1HVF1_9EURO|nr:40S ribosomal protein S27 [Phialophora attinorum]KPI43743.1 40S ribosomal protein S27 [Phialophora attinorum]
MASPKPVKILMLHGYTQNGSLFRAKTRVLEKRLQKALPSVSLTYPTGQIQLKPSDVPGFDGNPTESTEAYGWWRRRDDSDPPEYAEGPFDGVIGFSQGACFAAVVASLLDGDTRRKAFEEARSRSKHAIAYPKSFEDLDHPPLKFGIVYSGFIPPGERYEALYNPPIHTPLCHFIGSLDSVVEEARTQKLVDAAGGNDKTQVIVHPGGHFVPTSKQYLDIAAGFVEQAMRPKPEVNGNKEESAEDMDVLAVDLLNPTPQAEARKHKLKTLVPAPRSFFMDVKCPGCFTITTVYSHAQTVVVCAGCSTVLCQPTGGKARLTEGCSFRRK